MLRKSDLGFRNDQFGHQSDFTRAQLAAVGTVPKRCVFGITPSTELLRTALSPPVDSPTRPSHEERLPRWAISGGRAPVAGSTSFP